MHPWRLTLILLLLTTLSAQAALVAGPERPFAPPSFGEAPGWQRPLDIASDGTDFLVLWEETLEGRQGLYAVTVGADGARRSQMPLTLTHAPVVWGAKAVWTGDAYLVVWSEGDVRGVLLDRNGQMQSAPFPITSRSFVIGLAWDGAHALLAANDFDGTAMQLAVLNANGGVARQVRIPDNAAYDVVGIDGAFVAIITPISSDGIRRFRAIRISADLSVSDAKDIAERGAYAYAMAASDGRSVGVAITDDPGFVSRYTIDGDSLSVHEHGMIAGAGFSRDSALVVWAGAYAVTKAVTLDARLTVRTSEVRSISRVTRQQSDPAMATNGDVSLAAWSSCDDLDLCEVRALRLDREGHALDPQPLILATGVLVSSKIAILYTGETWLVAWQAGADFYGYLKLQRVSPAGGVLDASPRDLGPGAEPAFASNGSTVAMIYLGPPHGSQKNGAFVLRLSPAGELLTPERVTLTTETAREPAIASNGTEFLAVFAKSIFANGIFGVRLDASASPIDVAPIAIATTDRLDTNPAVASIGEDYVVAFDHHSYPFIVDPPLPDPPPSPPHLIYAKRVLHTGVLADTTADQPGHLLGEGGRPAIVAAGDRYGVFFRSFPPASSTRYKISLLGVTVDANGAPLSTARVLTHDESYFSNYGVVARNGVFELAYARVEDDAVFANTHRVFLRTVVDDGTRRRSSRR